MKLQTNLSKVWKKLTKGGYNIKLLEHVVDILVQGKQLPPKYKNHPLKGKYEGFYDCHILPDWVLIYKIEKEKLILLLLDIGSHSELFH